MKKIVVFLLIFYSLFLTSYLTFGQYTWQKEVFKYSILKAGKVIINDVDNFYGVSSSNGSNQIVQEMKISMTPEMEAEIERKRKEACNDQSLIKLFSDVTSNLLCVEQRCEMAYSQSKVAELKDSYYFNP